MTCPVCGEKCRVTDNKGDCEVTYRRRQCMACKHVFYTEEKETKEAKETFLDFRHEYDRVMTFRRITKRAKK